MPDKKCVNCGKNKRLKDKKICKLCADFQAKVTHTRLAERLARNDD